MGESQGIMDHLKKVINSCPILALPDFYKPCVLECDASGIGIGVVLMQDKHPIAYERRTLNEVERMFSTYDKENHECN